jgi:hypothetical protein
MYVCTLTLRKLILNEEHVCVCVCVCVCDGHIQCTNLSKTARSASHCCISGHTYSFCLTSTWTNSCLCSTALQSEQSMNRCPVTVSDCTEKFWNMYLIKWFKSQQVQSNRYRLPQKTDDRNSRHKFLNYHSQRWSKLRPRRRLCSTVSMVNHILTFQSYYTALACQDVIKHWCSIISQKKGITSYTATRTWNLHRTMM